MWYEGGDNKNGESKLAGKAFFDTDYTFRVKEFLHFSSQMLKAEPKSNAVFSRPQTFFGRLPEAIADVLSACGVRPYLVPAGIALMPADEPETENVLDLDSVSGPWKMGEENVL